MDIPCSNADIKQTLSLLHQLTKAIYTAASRGEAFSSVLAIICRNLNWSFAEAWLPNANTERLYRFAHYPEPEDDLDLLAFVEAGQKRTFARGEGLPGQVWAGQQSLEKIDISEISAAEFPRLSEAYAVKFRTALGVPILDDENVTAVLLFFGQQPTGQDSLLHPLLTAVANQLGTLLKQKQAEEALQYQSRLLSQVNDAILSTTLDLTITIWNDGAVNLYGWSADEAIGRNATELLQTDFGTTSRAAALAQLKSTGEWHGEVRQQTKDGRLVEVMASSSTIKNDAGEVVGLVAINRDISDKKQAERELIRRNRELGGLLKVGQQLARSLDPGELLETIVDTITDALPAAEAATVLLYNKELGQLLVAAHTGYQNELLDQLTFAPNVSLIRPIFGEGQAIIIDDVRANPAFELLGYPELDRLQSLIGAPLIVNEERIGATFADNFSQTGAFSEDDLRLLQALAAQASVALERARLHQELKTYANTMEKQVAQRTTDLTKANQQLRQEVSERRTAEAQLRYQASLLDQVSDAIISTDLDFHVVSWNKAAERIYGWQEEEAQKAAPDLLQTEFLGSETLESSVRALYETGNWRGEVRQATKSGRRIVVRSSVSLVHDHAGKTIGAVAINSDITEQRRTEESEQEQRALAGALRDSAAALSRSLDLDEVLDRILVNVRRVVPHEVGNIMLVDDDVLTIVRHHGYEQYGIAQLISNVRYSLANIAHLREMSVTGKPVCIGDTYQDNRWFQISGTEWIRSYIGAPIQWQGETLGFLNLDSDRPNFFTRHQAENLAAFADYAAIAIRNAQLYARARELASLRERERLARDLHDAVSQTLWSIALMADVLPQNWRQDREKGKRRLRRISQLARSALLEMRLLLLELRPADLLEVNLPELLGHLLESAAARAAAEKEIQIDDDCHLPPDVKMSLFRIAQEALNNVVRHAMPTRIKLSLRCRGGGVEVIVADDGRGFDPTAVAPGHLGLQVMRERAAGINAHFSIDTAVGTGTTVNIRWPEEMGKTA